MRGAAPHVAATSAHDVTHTPIGCASDAPVGVRVKCMTGSEYAAEELALWEAALREQREAERRLELARQPPYPADFYELLYEVDNLRSRADLLLAEAVKVKCAYRDGKLAR